MIIREALEPDFSTICELMKHELGYPNLDQAEAIKRLEYFNSNDDWVTYVAVNEYGEIIGFIGVMKGLAYNIEGYYAQIMALAVSEQSQRQKIGTKLVRKAEEWSLSNGIINIGVSSGLKRRGAHIFYERNGYTKRSFSFIKILSLEEES